MGSLWRIRAALGVCLVCLVGCDRASKVAAEIALRGHGPFTIVPGVADLLYTENRDIAFNALSRLSLHPPGWALSAFTIATAALVLGVLLRRRRAGWRDQAGSVLIAAGAIGNGMDRIARGHVVDFIHVHFWPVFNVADVLIVGGVALLVLGRTRIPATARAAGASGRGA